MRYGLPSTKAVTPEQTITPPVAVAPTIIDIVRRFMCLSPLRGMATGGIKPPKTPAWVDSHRGCASTGPR